MTEFPSLRPRRRAVYVSEVDQQRLANGGAPSWQETDPLERKLRERGIEESQAGKLFRASEDPAHEINAAVAGKSGSINGLSRRTTSCTQSEPLSERDRQLLQDVPPHWAETRL